MNLSQIRRDVARLKLGIESSRASHEAAALGEYIRLSLAAGVDRSREELESQFFVMSSKLTPLVRGCGDPFTIFYALSVADGMTLSEAELRLQFEAMKKHENQPRLA